jgi:chromosome segregation ATPase
MTDQVPQTDPGRRPDTATPESAAAASTARTEEAIDALRRSTAKVRRNGERLSDVHDQLQSSASRVQALRETARSLGKEIARTREAVENPERELND